MFSARLAWDDSTNPLTNLLAAQRAAGIDVLDLTNSNPTQAGFDYNHELILKSLANPAATVYQPSPLGLPVARAAVADYYRDRGQVVDPDSLLLTASTSEAYSFLFKLLCDPGDEVLTPQPGYPLFDFLTALDSVRPIFYPLQYTAEAGWRINFERLQAALGPRTRAVIVVSPHNPTGAYLSQTEIDQLIMLCVERHLALIVDEVFSDYASERGASLLGNNSALTFVLNGLSKIVGLPQVKLGWVQVNGPEPERRAALVRLEFIADTYLSVSASIQHAVPSLLADRHSIQSQIRSRLDENYVWLCNEITHPSTLLSAQALTRAQVLARKGGWYAVLEFQDTISDDKRAWQLLERDHVFFHPGYFYDFPREGYVVVSLLTRSDIFLAGMARLLAEWG